jgi:hypothetical protein
MSGVGTRERAAPSAKRGVAQPVMTDVQAVDEGVVAELVGNTFVVAVLDGV